MPSVQPAASSEPVQPISTPIPPEASATPDQPQASPEVPTASSVVPSVTAVPQQASWYGAGIVALFLNGNSKGSDLYSMDLAGTTRLVLSDIGSEAHVSPDGRWLGFFRWQQDGRGTLELLDAQSGEGRQISPNAASGLMHLVFDQESRRLAFVEMGALSAGQVPWTVVVVDLESTAVARYDGLMTDRDTRPLPGVPVGWTGFVSAGDELIIDTFVPYSEQGSMGAWGVTLPGDGQSAPLDALSLREVIPGAPTYSSALYLAPDGRDVAFLGRDPEYVPDGYAAEYYDLAVNWLGMAALDSGVRTILVRASDGSALAHDLSWSPSGERLLFAQGHYDGANLAELSLKSSDRHGVVVEYGSLGLTSFDTLLHLVWCDDSLVLFITFDGTEATQHLHLFDLNTGVSREISVGQRIEIVGCAP